MSGCRIKIQGRMIKVGEKKQYYSKIILQKHALQEQTEDIKHKAQTTK